MIGEKGILTYSAEAMLWLEGGRALQTGLEIRESRERKSATA